MKKPTLIALFTLLAMWAHVVTAVDLPSLEDLEMAGWMKNIGDDYAKYRIAPEAFFDKPTEAKSWPCAISPAHLSKLAGIVSLADETPKVKQAYARSLRPMGAEYLKAFYAYQNVHFYPVKASCLKGKLSGETEFLVDFEKVDSMPKYKTVIQFTKRLAFNAVAGEREGLVREYIRTGDFVDGSGDPQYLQIFRKKDVSVAFIYSFINRSVILSHVILAGENAISNGQPSITTSRPLPDGRIAYVQYVGKDKWMELTLKDGVYHGPAKSYPRTMGSGEYALKLPGESLCYKDGELYKADPCDVE